MIQLHEEFRIMAGIKTWVMLPKFIIEALKKFGLTKYHRQSFR